MVAIILTPQPASQVLPQALENFRGDAERHALHAARCLPLCLTAPMGCLVAGHRQTMVGKVTTIENLTCWMDHSSQLTEDLKCNMMQHGTLHIFTPHSSPFYC